MRHVLVKYIVMDKAFPFVLNSYAYHTLLEAVILLANTESRTMA